MNIIFTIYAAAIVALFILKKQNERNNLTIEVALIKGLSFTVAKTEDYFEDEDETDSEE